MRREIVLLVVGIVVCLGTAVSAGVYGGGTGAEEDPYQIWTAEQMNTIGLYVEDWDKHFVLMADIDLSAYTGSQFNTIGRYMLFEGALDICLDTNSDTMYWTNDEKGIIQWANTNPIDFQDFVVIEPDQPTCITIDHVNDKIYWTSVNDKIQRANLDGSEVEDVITTGISNAGGIAVDGINGKIYWTETSLEIIKRADIDGSNIVDLIVNDVEDPYDIILDIDNGYLYWGRRGSRGALYRARLDGTEQTLIAYSLSVRGLAIDKINEKVYWTDNLRDLIRRANLDGTEVEDVLSTGYGVAGITLDTANSKIYWTHSSIYGSIRRANYDGSEIEILIPPRAFSGVCDGNGHVISNFTYINPGANYKGIFDCIESPGEVLNLILEAPRVDIGVGQGAGSLVGLVKSGSITNCSIQNADITGGEYIGGLSGSNKGTLTNCTSENVNITGERHVGGLAGYSSNAIIECDVSGNIQGDNHIGGIVGYKSSSLTNSSFVGSIDGVSRLGGLAGYNLGTIDECYCEVTIDGDEAGGGLAGRNGGLISNSSSVASVVCSSYVGGLVGDNGGTIQGSFSEGSVNADQKGGGLVGENDGEIFGSYSMAEVTCVSDAGGLVGSNYGSIHGSYSTGLVTSDINAGGLVGIGDDTDINASLWDIETSGQSISVGGIGMTTSDMQTALTYEKLWACESEEWTIQEEIDYPRLLWEGQPGEIIGRHNYGGGSGTFDDPYLIYTVEHLKDLSETECDAGMHFKLMADIDLSVVDPNEMFMIVLSSGNFDGNKHIISNFRFYSEEYVSSVGLFKTAGSATIKDLGLDNVDIYVENSETGELSGRYIGGLVGSGGNILRCYVTGSVYGGQYVGGIAGSGVLQECYGDVQVNGNQYVGGLLGIGTLLECYAVGQVAGNEFSGGLCGKSNTSVSSCLWDIETTGQEVPVGYIGSSAVIEAWGKTTAEMYSEDTFMDAGWDFVGEWVNGPHETWIMPPGHNYPVLWWQIDEWKLPELPSFSGGIGDPNDPYVISSVEDLNKIGHNERLMNSHFIMVSDLDLAEDYFYTIGSVDYPFYGTFEGNGHVISNLFGSNGLFESICTGSCISNITFDNIQIEGDGNIGGVAKDSYKSSIFGCRVFGNINGTGSVGGIVSHCQYSIIDSCCVDGHIAGFRYIGGIIGKGSSTEISSCYSRGYISAISYAGGLIGSISEGSVENCYSLSDVWRNYSISWGWSTVGFGGLIGTASTEVRNCYATGRVYNVDSHCGGLIGGGNSDYVESSFWDIETTQQDTSAGGEGLTTEQMYTRGTFADSGWDFENTWDILEGYSYPYLQIFPIPAPQMNKYIEPEDDVIHLDPTTEIILSWKAGSGATSHDLFFGTESPPPFVQNQTETSFEPSLEYCKTYYWRVDGIGPGGITEGEIWSFSTIPWQGDGSEENPYLVNSAEALVAIAKYPDKYGSYFTLTQDVDLSTIASEDFTIIDFSGIFDGNGYAIQNYTYSSTDPEQDCIAMFQELSGSATVIKNLTLFNPQIEAEGSYIGSLCGKLKYLAKIENCKVLGGSIDGGNYTGGLIGYSYSGHILNCEVSCDVSGNTFVGGIAGYNGESNDTKEATIENCHTTGNITGINSVGGIVGYNLGYADTGRIINSHSSGNVTGTGTGTGGIVGTNKGYVEYCSAVGDIIGNERVGGAVGYNIARIYWSCSKGNVSGYQHVGGLIGWHYGYQRVYDCYATGNVNGNSQIGGLIGIIDNEYGPLVRRSYSTGLVSGTDCVGGLVGQLLYIDGGEPSDCYWDVETSGTSYSAGGTGKTTNEMMSIDIFHDWIGDFYWKFNPGIDYPRLAWEDLPSEFVEHIWFSGGFNTADEPLLISSAEELNNISNSKALMDNYFKLISDIELAELGGPFQTIGSSEYPFSGYFNGDGHVIFNFVCEGGHGLFGYTKNYGEISNVTLQDPFVNSVEDRVGALVGMNDGINLTNCHVTGGQVIGDVAVGGLAGSNDYTYYNSNTGIIRNCHSEATVKGTEFVGGLVGRNRNYIYNSYATGNVEGAVRHIGGLIGGNDTRSMLKCYATGNVSGNESSNFVGGLIGSADCDRISDCYANGSVSGGYNIGGLIGESSTNSLLKCFSTGAVSGKGLVGGLVGRCYGGIFDCFWDIETSGMTDGVGYPDPDGVIGLTTTQMQTQSSFTDYGWDFLNESTNGTNDIWRMCVDGIDYPHLSWEYSINGDFACPDGVGTDDLLSLSHNWLNSEEVDPDFNYPCDPTFDGVTNLADYVVLAENWLSY